MQVLHFHGNWLKIMDKIKKQTFKASLYSYLGIALGFFTQGWLIPNTLTKTEVGLTNNIFAIAIILIQFTALGFGSAAIKYFPYFHQKSKNHHGFLFLTSLIPAFGTLLVFLALIFFKDWVLAYYHHDQMVEEYYYTIFVIVLGLTYFAVFDNFLRNLGNATTGVLLKEFILRVFIALAVILYFLKLIDFKVFMLFWSISYFLITLLGLLKIGLDGELNFIPNKPLVDKKLLKEMFVFSLFTFLTGMSYQIAFYIDRIMISSYKSLSDSGIYSVASQFAMVIIAPAMAMIRAITPTITKAWKEDNREIIDIQYKQSCISLLIIGCWVYLGIITNLSNVFQFLPQGYEVGSSVIIIVGLGKIFDMATGINSVILVNSPYYKYDSLFFLLLIVLTIALNHLLIPIYGIDGSAIATMLATIAFNGFRTWFIYYKYKMQPFSSINLYIVVLALTSYFITMQIPYNIFGNIAKVEAILNLIIRSSLLTILFLGSIYLFKLYQPMNQLFEGLMKRIIKN